MGKAGTFADARKPWIMLEEVITVMLVKDSSRINDTVWKGNYS